MKELLIELFSEEIPARMQGKASEDLKKLMTDGLVEAGLTYASAAAFATPRRLALVVEGLSEASQERREERKGPKVGAPEQAVEGFLRSTGLSRDDLEVRPDKKGEAYFATITTPGRPAAEIVAEVLETTIRNFPWPKSMRWGAGSLRWVRPLHRILCVLSDEGGTEVVPFELDGIRAGDRTSGHRFMGPADFSVRDFEDYEAKLTSAHVILRPESRAETIRHDATQLAFAKGFEVVEDEGLLAEVAGLVEWPVALMGRIEEAFLGLPPEVLQTSMKEHQKFFSVRNPKSGRIEAWITVANIEAADGGAAILAGNSRVLRARLSDAKFFWDNDLREVKARGLEGMAEGLARVTFQSKLGTQAERVARIAALARIIAPMVGADAEEAATAAAICKADLRSEMVGEFPELQGLMGRYYAEAAGHAPEVAAAAQEHYAPLGPSDDVPTAPLSVTLALADKLDTLAGFWAVGEKPTGSKDPFALRRAALGVIRLILTDGLRLPLDELILAANKLTDVPDLMRFFHDRLKVALRDRGLAHDVIDACLTGDAADLAQVAARAEALAEVLKTDDGVNLVQGFKRANNILSQAEAADGVEYSFGAERKFTEDPAEVALFDALDAAEAKITPALEAEDFAGAMAAMAALRAPIDAFFEAVQVNADNQVLRRNRLNLLNRIRAVCLKSADLTRLEG
ncbi:glycine--tRNA ligase subunit beta [Pseudoroseicyclus sp. CXY001]|uniref:glycine--tRNA ligase subunit beta n=1 Tax=Pseudoroseicyclus sp. CXY001 TaxID=3242492 RepID=UPI00358DC12D